MTNKTLTAAEQDVLLQRIGRGEKEALGQLYRATSTAVYGYALSVLKNPQDAQDVLHDCYLAVWNGAGGYRPMGKPMAWVLTVCKNLCYGHLRQRQRQAAEPASDWQEQLANTAGPGPEDMLVLKSCMECLGDTERQIVTLHVLGGLRFLELAGLLEMPLSTVLSKYRRAMQRLRRELQ